ncbi:helix-turn-helix transcriptional regulator [Cognatishimia sp.]|uniref:AraC family transcriptional regulator n=1 Tax=Cognatishimia sp. TaxID=2211648 RepID=UPI003518CE1D
MLNEVLYNSPNTAGAPYPYAVLAAGRSRVTPQTPSVSTRFGEHTLILTIEGVGAIVQRDVETRAWPLSVSWVDTSGRYRHGCAPDAESWDYLWFSFTGFASDALFERVSQRSQAQALAEPDVAEVFGAVLREVAGNTPGRQARLSSLVAQALAAFETQPRQAGHLSLERLTSEMLRDLAVPWDTKAMAQEVGLSVSRLHAAFRDAFGLPPATWLRDQRINKAKRLLTETDVPVSQIGAECGYPDPHHFSREFAKNAMLSPSRFRSQMRSRVGR